MLKRSIVDKLYQQVKEEFERKPRTYRIKARKNYFEVAKQRRPRKKNRRKAIRKQLAYLNNESLDLQFQIEQYLRRFGHYPESVHVDRIYPTSAAARKSKVLDSKSFKLFNWLLYLRSRPLELIEPSVKNEALESAPLL